MIHPHRLLAAQGGSPAQAVGDLYVWGHGDYSGFGQYTPKILVPTLLASVGKVKKAVAGEVIHVILEDGSLKSWGSNSAAVTGTGTSYLTKVYTPLAMALPGGEKFVDVTNNSQAGAVVRDDGGLYTWGHDAYRGIGSNSSTKTATPTLNPWMTTIEATSKGYAEQTFAVYPGGVMRGWGANGWKELGFTTSGVAYNPTYPVAPNCVKVAAGGTYSLELNVDGTIWASGFNYGTFGDGTIYVNKITFGQTVGGSWVDVAAGNNATSYGIKSDGTLWAWGQSSNGSIGDGLTSQRLSPVMINSDSWASVSAGYDVACAIKSDGSLWAWGYGYAGQLGYGGTANRYSPVLIDAGPWLSVSVGRFNTVGVKK